MKCRRLAVSAVKYHVLYCRRPYSYPIIKRRLVSFYLFHPRWLQSCVLVMSQSRGFFYFHFALQTVFYPIHTEIFAPKSNEINFIPVRDCWLLVGRFLSLVKNIVRPITGHGRLFVTSEENRRALSVFSQRLASNGELFFISRQIKWHQDLRI